MFVRYPDGIRVLEGVLERLGKSLVSYLGKGPARTIAVVAITNRILQLKQTLEDMENHQGVFTRDEELDRAAEVAVREIKRLQAQLREFEKEGSGDAWTL